MAYMNPLLPVAQRSRTSSMNNKSWKRKPGPKTGVRRLWGPEFRVSTKTMPSGDCSRSSYESRGRTHRVSGNRDLFIMPSPKTRPIIVTKVFSSAWADWRFDLPSIHRCEISASLAMLGKLSVAGTACRDRHQLVDKENILGFARSIDP